MDSKIFVKVKLLFICAVILAKIATAQVSQATDVSDESSHQAIPDEQRLLTKLMRNYDNAVRPVINASQNIVVNFGFTLIQIMDMDERNQAILTNVWLEHEWYDERLRWDPAEYNNLTILRVPARRLWLPDIVLYNNADDFTAGYMLVNSMVSSTGRVFWAPPARLRSSCKVDITYFPFDDQKCILKFGSWAYDKEQVDIVNKTADLDTGNYVTNGEWLLIGSKVERNEVVYPISTAIYPDVTVSFFIRRRILYYVINIIVPCVWLNFLSLLSFRLPPDAGEKITLGITVLLSYSVFTLLVAESMPATSEFIPLIGIYLTISMALTSISVVFTVWVLTIHHCSPQQTEVPQWMRSLVLGCGARFFSCSCCRDSCCRRRQSGARRLHASQRKGNGSSGGSSIFKNQTMRSSVDNATAEACLRLINDVDLKRGYDKSPIRADVAGGCNGGVAIEFEELHRRPLYGGAGDMSTTPSSLADFGRVGPCPSSPYVAVQSMGQDSVAMEGRKLAVMEEMARALRVIVDKRDEEDARLAVAGEWRQVAQVVDTLLFWAFFFSSVAITLIMIVIVPYLRPPIV